MPDPAPETDRTGRCGGSCGFGRTAFATSSFLSGGDRALLGEAMLPARTPAAGAELIREGDSVDCLYVLVDGWAYRYKTVRDGGRLIVALLLPGDVCNLDAIAVPRARDGVRTVTPATVLPLSRSHVLSLVTGHAGIARTVAALALAENATLAQWALSLGRRPSRARLAHLLCEIGYRLDAADAGEARFDLPLTQEHIADALGLTSVHVNRVMQELRREGLIASGHRRIVVPDVQRLRAAGHFDPAYLRDAADHGMTAGAAPSQG